MRVVVIGLAIGLGLILATLGRNATVSAERPGEPAGRGVASDIIALSSPADDTRQQVVLVDTKARVMGVYHIDRRSGEITLKSVRTVHWDLLMEEFNSNSPAPRDIRSLLQPPR